MAVRRNDRGHRRRWSTTFAAFVYLGTFDFSAHPGQVPYIAAYLLVGIPSVIVLWHTLRRGSASETNPA